jgi:lantibiotic modifying enzyme
MIHENPAISDTWSPFIRGDLRQRTVEIIKMVADRYCQREIVSAQVTAQSSLIQSSTAHLANGYGGLALAFLYLGQYFPELHYMAQARTYLHLAAQVTQEQEFPHEGLFSGSSGLALILSSFARDVPAYQRASQTMNQALARRIREKSRQRDGMGVALNNYDVINGTAGIVGYLLSLKEEDGFIEEALSLLLQDLIWLADEDEESKPKRWFIQPAQVNKASRRHFPDGYFNLGLAHGLPGPLAALALAHSAGYRLPGMQEAITTFATWIIEQSVRDTWSINWPDVIVPGGSPSQPMRPLAGWCYGTPGVARSLWLAGTALANDSWRDLAIEGIEAGLARALASQKASSSTICHGLSGLLLISMYFAHESSRIPLCQGIPLLVQRIIDAFNPDYPFGFYDITNNNIDVDNPGLLAGSIGTALTLLAATTSFTPNWSRAFLIA